MHIYLYIQHTDTHALVQFDEDHSSSIIPLNRVQKVEELCEGGSCKVQWSDKKRYGCILICSGN